jgi:mRNA interferase RelE/StbE
MEIEEAPVVEHVLDWLADRLTRTVRLAREDVAAMDLQQAVDRWTAYMSEPKPGTALG